MTVTVEYRARLPIDARAPAAARRLCRCLETTADREILDSLELLVTELVTNSVRHAGLGQDGFVEIELHVGPVDVRVEVRDPGRGFDPDVVRRRPEVRGDGWGLYLVDQIAERWGVHQDEFQRVWFELPLRTGSRNRQSALA
jgi:anti-sigma regulatory factor (Ser/Thr protein kinase)